MRCMLVLPAAVSVLLGQPPAEVCLTNACADAPKLPQPGTIAEAIQKGDGRRVRELGGTPVQVVDALKAEIRVRQSNPQRAQEMIDRLSAFADLSGGARLAFQDMHNGSQVRSAATGEDAGFTQWGIDRTNPDGTVQTVALLPQGGVFIGLPHAPD